MKNYLKSLVNKKNPGSIHSVTSDQQRSKFISNRPMQRAASTRRTSLTRKYTVISVVNGGKYGNTNSESDTKSRFGSNPEIERVISEMKKAHSRTEDELKNSTIKLCKELASFFSFFVCYVLFGMFLFFYIEECSGAPYPDDGSVSDAVDVFTQPSYKNLTETCYNLYVTIQNITSASNISSIQSYEFNNFFKEKCGQIVSQSALPVLMVEKYDREKCQFDESMLLKYAEFTIFSLLTIGYGNIAPATIIGRTCLVFYAAIGIPLAVTMYSVAGQLIVQAISLGVRIFEFRVWGVTRDPKLQLKSLIVSIFFMFLVMLIGCSITTSEHMENLDFSTSFYFWFVSLTTIGFGDIHFDRNKHLAHPHLMILASMNILFGLGIVAAIIKAFRLTLERGNLNATAFIIEEGDDGELNEESIDEDFGDDEPEFRTNEVTANTSPIPEGEEV